MADFIDTDLIEQIERLISETDIKPTVFGRLAIKDANLLGELKEGRELRFSTRKRVLEAIASIRNDVSGKSDTPMISVNARTKHQVPDAKMHSGAAS